MILITYLLKESKELIDVIESNNELGFFEKIFCYVKKIPNIPSKNIIYIEDSNFKIKNIYKILSQNVNKMCIIANPQHLITSFTTIKNFIENCGYKTCWKFGPNIILDTSFCIDKQFINKLISTQNINDFYKNYKFKLLDISDYILFDNKVPSEQIINFSIEKSEKIILTNTDLSKLSNIHVNCINLKRATDRRLRINNFFQGYDNLTLINAVDGDTLDLQKYKYPKTSIKSIYEIATNFSHLLAIKTAYDQGLEICLIMEDDMDLSLLSRWEFDLNFILTNSPEDWEILQLYTNNPNLMLKLHEHFNTTRMLWTTWLASAWSAGFYVIRRSGMEKILNRFYDTNRFDLTKFDKDMNFLVADFIIYDSCKTYLINKPIIHDDAFNSYIHTNHVNTYHLKSKNFVTKLYQDKSINILRHDEYNDENIVYLNGFWKGFDDKTDGVHIGLLEQIFKGTKLDNFKLTNNMNDANILIESVFTTQSIAQTKLWKYKIQVSGESRILSNEYYNYVLSSNNEQNNIITFPFGFQFLHTNGLSEKLVNRDIITTIPKHFCCWIVSNPNCELRNKMFMKLSEYKKVHSYGSFLNNMGFSLKFSYWTENYRKFMSSYKFIICFENRKFEKYITEKLINPFIARTVPIYWGTDYVDQIFNKNAYLRLEDETDSAIEELIKKIIYLDTHNEEYLKMLNEPVIANIDEYNKYLPENISKKLIL